jgi:hypothetical protein
MPPTFNFLAGNQEAEENKALKWIIDQSPEGLIFEGARTAPTVPGIVRYFNVGQSWKGWVRISINKPGRRRFMSAYQKEAIYNGHRPKMNRISEKSSSVFGDSVSTKAQTSREWVWLESVPIQSRRQQVGSKPQSNWLGDRGSQLFSSVSNKAHTSSGRIDSLPVLKRGNIRALGCH